MAIMVEKRTFRPVANFGNHPLGGGVKAIYLIVDHPIEKK